MIITRRLKHRAIQLTIIVLFVSLVIFVGKPVSDRINKKLEQVKISLFRSAEERTGIKVSYDSISPGIISGFTIHNLKVMRENGTLIASIEHFSLKVSLIELVTAGSSEERISAIKKIVIRNSFIYWDRQVDSSLFAPKERDDSLDEGGSGSFPFRAIIAGRNINIYFTDEDLSLSLSGFKLNISDTEEFFSLTSSGTFFGAFSREESSDYFSLDIDITGSIDHNFELFTLYSKFKNFDSSLISFSEEQVFLITMREGLLEIQKVYDTSPFNLSFIFHTADNLMELNFYAEDWILEESIQLKREGAGASLLKESRISVSAISGFFNGTYALSNGNFEYETDLQLAGRAGDGSPYTALLSFEGDQSAASFENLALNSRVGGLSFYGQWVKEKSLFPSGELLLRNLGSSQSSLVNARLQIVSNSNGVVIRSEDILVGESRISLFQSGFLFFNDTIESLFSVQIEENGGESIEGRGQLFLGDKVSYNMNLTVASLAAENLIALLPLDSSLKEGVLESGPFKGEEKGDESSLKLSSALSLSGVGGDFHLDIGEASLYNEKEGIVTDYITFQAELTPQRGSLYNLQIQWGDYRGEGRFEFSQIGRGEYTLFSYLTFNDYYYQVTGELDEKTLFLHGLYGFEAVYLFPAKGEGFFQIRSKQLPFLVDEQLFNLSLNISGRQQGGAWQIRFTETEVDFRQKRSDFQLSLSGSYDGGKSQLYLHRATLKSDVSVLYGYGNVSLDKERTLSGWLLFGDTYDEQITVGFQYSESYIKSDVSIINFPLHAFPLLSLVGTLPEGLIGTANANLQIEGPLSDLSIRGSLSLSEGRLGRTSYSASLQLASKQGVVRVSDANIGYGSAKLERGLFLFNSKKGTLQGTAEVATNIQGASFLTSFTLNGSFPSQESPSVGGLANSGLLFSLLIDPVYRDDEKNFPGMTLYLREQSGVLYLYDSDYRLINGSYNIGTEEFYLTLSESFPIALKSYGNWGEEAFSIVIEKFFINLQLINLIMPTDPIHNLPFVIFKRGLLYGNITASGEKSAPLLDGTLFGADVLPQTPYIGLEASVSPTSVYATLEEGLLSIEPFDIPIDSGFLRLRKGELLFDGWNLERLSFIVDSLGRNGLPIEYAVAGFEAKGFFNGEIAIDHEESNTYLDGEFEFFDMAVTPSSATSVEELEELPPADGDDTLDLNFKIRFGKNVRFSGPSPTVTFLKGIVTPGSEISELSYNSATNNFSMVGAVELYSGDIYYGEKSFRLREGEMTFNETQNRFNPYLDVSAETVIQDSTGQDITILLEFSDFINNPFTPTWSSTPTRTESEILALITGALLPTEQTEEGTTVDYLSPFYGIFNQTLLFQPVEEVIKRTLNVDQFTINSRLVERFFIDSIGGQITKQGAYGSYNLASYLDDTTVTIGKYLENSIFLQGYMTLKYDDRAVVSTISGNFNYNFGGTFEMKTPFKWGIDLSLDWDPAKTNPFTKLDTIVTIKWSNRN